jgi:pimeloyl-ACP methyl ester carboxylesterase
MIAIPHLRTPDDRFDTLPGYPWSPHYMDRLPSLQGLRMHYLDEGPRDAAITWLCLHGNPAWSYLYRHMIPVFLAAGHRVVAPDMPGFGKSDKPADVGQHRFSWHRAVLLEFIEAMDLQQMNLVVQDWGGLLGLTLPLDAPHRYRALLVMNTYLATGESDLPPGFTQWRAMCRSKPDFSIARLFARGNPHLSDAECAAYDAPFPDLRYRAATRAFPEMVADTPLSDGADVSGRALKFWQTQRHMQSLMAVGVQDPVFNVTVMEQLRTQINGCPAMLQIEDGGHFLQEHGRPIASVAVARLSPEQDAVARP